MTGFGKKTSAINGKNISVEIKALNSRYLDLNIKLPAAYREMEADVRSLALNVLLRGKVEILMEVEASEQKQYQINKAVFDQYYSDLKQLTEDRKLPEKDILNVIMQMPDVVQSQQKAGNDEEQKQILKLIEEVLSLLDKFRLDEGQQLADDLKMRIQNIEKLEETIKEIEPRRKALVKDRLEEKIKELKEEIDRNRLEQEIVYYIEKLDMTEELVRLSSHCEYFVEALNDKEDQKGKKLSFISQEIGREINTIGAKAYDADIQRKVVEMKEQLEKIKEQVNNIL